MTTQRTQEEISRQVGMAWEAIEEERTEEPGKTYEHGVQAALEWITGQLDDPPIEDGDEG